MHQELATTPFGRRKLTLAHVATQVAARERSTDKVVHKWRCFRDLCAAKDRVGVTDRGLAVLNAFMSFHQETALTGDDLVVYPSNRQLSLRANGMAPSTLRRHIANLVDCGLVIRRDSPNGKRYARKGRGGEVEQAFGFDLSPLVAKADQIQAWAEEARAEDHAARLARERITLHRRDIAKMIDTAMAEGIATPDPGWVGLNARYLGIVAGIPKGGCSAALTPSATELSVLADEIRNVLETHVIRLRSCASEFQNERHIQNSNPESIFDEGVPRKNIGATVETPDQMATPSRAFPFAIVLEACPDVVDYAKGGVRSWQDLVSVADLIRSMLGVSPSAWAEARQVLGPEHAAIAIACILQRAEAISAPGGYLRAIVGRAREGRFSVGPMLLALLRSGGKGKEARRTG